MTGTAGAGEDEEGEAPVTNDASQREALIGRYLDGLMSEGEADAFRAQLAVDGELAGEVALQEAIVKSLRRTLGPVPRVAPPAPTNGEAVLQDQPLRPAGTARPQLGVRRRRLIYGAIGAAAAVAIAGVIGWQAGMFTPAGPAQRLYAQKKEDGFSYKWACASEAEFIEHTTIAFTQPLVVDSTPDVQILGWDYVPDSWDPNVGLLVAKVDNADVLVMIEPPGCGKRHVRPRPGGGLSVFTRRIGNVIIYEITPLEYPGTLKLFRIP